jgi:uncharacterized membrane protein
MIDHAVAQRLNTNSLPSSSTPAIRRIGVNDLGAALALGWDDFRAIPSQLFFLCIIYPVVALAFWKLAAGYGLLPLFYPLASGFALIGPLAAVGLYEISMRRERGEPASWLNCFDVLRSPAIGSVIALALALVAIFLLWIAVAEVLFNAAFGDVRFGLMSDFLGALFTTSGGWFLIVAGNFVGLAFACVVLGISVVSFPLILDRNVDVGLAIRTSLQAVTRNPVTLGVWGLLVAVLVALGSLLAFVGLAVVLPVLGHATWHLYRRLIAA